MDIAFCCAKIRDTIMLSDRGKSLTVSITDLSRNVQHFILHILDDIIVQLKWRFKNFCVLSFPGLVDCSINSDSSGGDKVTEASAHSTRYNIIGGKILFCTEED